METLVEETQDFQKPDGQETIELFIASSKEPAQLSSFMLHLEQTCKNCNHPVGIIGRCGSCVRGDCITILLMTYSPLEIVYDISNMADVEIVEEDQLKSGVFSRFFPFFASKRLSHYDSNRRFHVILNGTDEEM